MPERRSGALLRNGNGGRLLLRRMHVGKLKMLVGKLNENSTQRLSALALGRRESDARQHYKHRRRASPDKTTPRGWRATPSELR